MNLKLADFTYTLPETLIAKEPADYRDEARLMVIHRDSGEIEHKKFKDIVNYFDKGDLFVVNNAKVFPARMYGRKEKTGAKIEVFLLRELNKENRLWDVLVDPARKIRVGNKLFFGENDNDSLVAEVIDNTTSRGRTIRFICDAKTDDEFRKILFGHGETPLPKYMNRKVNKHDEANYQTIFAKDEGAVAVPAAGLHFSKEILKWFDIKGIELAEVTMHLGLSAYKPVEVEDLTKHKMDSEHYVVPREAVEKVNAAKENKKRICCVGNSTLRALESSVSSGERLKPVEGWTEKFILPTHGIHIPTCLVTNFHAPLTPFYITTSTFVGHELMKKAYKLAIKEKYHFLDYGDAMLIL